MQFVSDGPSILDDYLIHQVDETSTMAGAASTFTTAKRRQSRRGLSSWPASHYPQGRRNTPGRRLGGSYHDSQDWLSGLVYRACHPLQKRWIGRKGLPRSGGLADRRGN